jgi:hypothetical protein
MLFFFSSGPLGIPYFGVKDFSLLYDCVYLFRAPSSHVVQKTKEFVGMELFTAT